MTPLSWGFSALAAADAALHLMACTKHQTILRTVTKILFLPLLLGAYLCSAQTLVPLLIAGLLFGWLGDLFLLGSERFFFFSCGTACFALGHFCYVGVLSMRFPAIQSLSLPQLLLLCLSATAVPALVVWYLRRELKGKGLFAVALPGYLFILTLLCAAGMTALLLTKTPAAGILTLGTILFLCSDVRLILLYVRRGPMAGCSDFTVMLTYFLAQTLLLTAFCL